MKFINRGEPIKIRKGDLINYNWITLKTNEIIDLPKEVGERNGLEKIGTVPIEINKKPAETKVMDYTADDLFFKELTKIKGVGPKTAKDIVVWGTREKLIEEIKLKAPLPFRDDIVKLLEKKYG